MKKLVLGMILVFPLVAVAQAEDKGSISVEVKNLRNDKGQVILVLHNKPDAFPKKSDQAVKRTLGKIKDKKATVVFDGIPYGDYAVALVHDENGNGKMDYKFGMPQEGYGFSNDAKGMLGPPDYKDAKFDLKAKKLSIAITLNY
jgi:uncharacterized protein (DUF2141 family)